MENYAIFVVYEGIGALVALVVWALVVWGPDMPQGSGPQNPYGVEREASCGIVLLLAIIVAWQPEEIGSTGHPPGSECRAYLMQIQGAKATWAQEWKKSVTDFPFYSDIFGPTNYIREVPFCPAGGIYRLGGVGEDPACSSGKLGHHLGPPVPRPRRTPRRALKALAMGLGAATVVLPAILLTGTPRRRQVER